MYTIRDATSSLSLSVMDFLPASDFEGGHGGAPVRWGALVDALLAVAFAKPVTVRLLVAHWAHTSGAQVEAMGRLAAGLDACAGSRYQPCAGSLEVRVSTTLADRPSVSSASSSHPSLLRSFFGRCANSTCLAGTRPTAAARRRARGRSTRASRTRSLS